MDRGQWGSDISATRLARVLGFARRWMPASNVKLLEPAMLQMPSAAFILIGPAEICLFLICLFLICLFLNVDLSGSRAGFEEKSIVRRSSPSGFYKAHVSVGGVVCWFGFSGLADFGKRTLHVPVAQF